MRRKLKTLEEVEEFARIQRTEAPSWTRDQARALERKILGPYWGRARQKMKGWPR